MKRVTTVSATDDFGEIEVLVATTGRSREAVTFRHKALVEAAKRAIETRTLSPVRVRAGRART